MIRRRRILSVTSGALLVMVLALAVGNTLLVPIASADPGGRTATHGYFTNTNYANCTGSSVCGAVLLNGGDGTNALNGITTKAKLVTLLTNLHNGKGSTDDDLGADFIIQLMRGEPYDHNRVSAADLADWKDRINDPNITVGVDDSVSYGGWNSARTKGQGKTDEIFFAESGSAKAIVVKYKGATVFKIKVACGNPLGDLPGLPEPKKNTPPKGVINIACGTGTNAGKNEITFTFYDADSKTFDPPYLNYGYLTGPGGYESLHYPSDDSSTGSKTLYKGPADMPNINNGITLTLHVLDRDPTAADAYVITDTATTKNCSAPGTNNPPTGTLTVSCGTGANVGKEQISVTFNDADSKNSNPSNNLAYVKDDNGSYETLPHVSGGTGGAPGAFTKYIPFGTGTGTIPDPATTPDTLHLFVYDRDPTAADSYKEIVSQAKPTIMCAVPVAASCNATPSGDLDVGQALGTVTVNITATNGSLPASSPGQMIVVSPSGATFYSSAVTYAGSNTTSTASGSTAATLTESGVYAIKATYPPDTTFGTKNCGTFKAVFRPYFEVQGGDVMAGVGVAPGCTVGAGDGMVTAFNRGNSGQPYKGSATDRAILALKNIKGMASATLGESGAPTSNLGIAGQPVGLDFSNNNPNDPGHFSTNALGCAPDYAADVAAGVTPVPATNVSLTNKKSNVYVYSGGPFTLSGVVSAGQSISMVFNGDVVINANITYENYTGLAKAPKLTIISTGNIFVVGDVDTITGFYSAQNGTIATCADAAGNESISPASCNTQLNINGALTAKNIRFNRTIGSLDTAPAEKVIFSPELWAARLNDCTASCAATYDAITSLAPVL